MATFKFLDPLNGTKDELKFSELANLIGGSSIRSVALFEDDKLLELNLSDNFTIRVRDLNVELVSTLNNDESATVRLQLIDDYGDPELKTVEAALKAFRNVYSIIYLVNNNREDDAFSFINNDRDSLNWKEQLYVSAAGDGSFWVTFIAKSKAAFATLREIAPLFYSEGRRAILERVKARTELVKLEVEKKAAEVNLQKAHGVADLFQKLDKIKDTNMKESITKALAKNLKELGKPVPPHVRGAAAVVAAPQEDTAAA